ncbi:hypothetical protein Patl1_30386 [Pistacia atlantica]|uniref:Uncharacterized protein n=1 Tax=Pistacia atlantica TaxID=434234 RepID=A0ACC1AC40_9ROSI|nr:hypothetical protein Patl1_30386 [Pistacia atlantica]
MKTPHSSRLKSHADASPWHCDGALQVGFYRGKCGLLDVESIVRAVVTVKFLKDRTIAPALIRMQFHDCFVNGCDASILLDGNSTEKTAGPNLSVRGYEVIDAVKDAVEKFCPGVVSCADIIAIATRDVVYLSGGGKYSVETGRRDGFVSLAKNVKLPGGHTIGVAHCNLFQARLYNYKNTGKPDPSMDLSLLETLKKMCPQNSTGFNTVNLDQNPKSASIVDNSFHKQIKMHRGVLQIDQDLALDSLTKATVDKVANGFDFSTKFGRAMVKMGAIQVLTGKQGEIRKSCRAVNRRF